MVWIFRSFLWGLELADEIYCEIRLKLLQSKSYFDFIFALEERMKSI